MSAPEEPPKDKSKLRTGFTTGACATAAARAAAEMLASGEDRTRVTIRLPIGRKVTFALERHERHPDGSVTCAVVKDAGDDPDCTHGAHLTATLRRTAAPGVHLAGGEGVGTITRPGLGLPVGAPAINPVPRRMIEAHVAEVLEATGTEGGVEVTVSVPGGTEMARKTLNARLGIEGGISILGTTGIVKPYSTAAFRASVEQGVQVAAAQGADPVVFTTGGRSENFARALLPELPEAAFVQMGDFVGFALKCAARYRVRRVTICGMIGKLSKLADGRRQTHAAGSQVNTALLARLARAKGAPRELARQIGAANTGRHAMELAAAAGFTGLADAVAERAAHCAERFADGRVRVTVILTDFDGHVLGRHPADPGR
jgi:cobalt-precorrin-5B (C1)-methyltransferase